MSERKPRRKRRSSTKARQVAAARRSGRAARSAYEAAALLGPFDPVEPASRHEVDDFPQLGTGQVYAFQAGTVLHPLACQVVMHQWDTAPETVKVLEEHTVGARKMCGICRTTAV